MLDINYYMQTLNPFDKLKMKSRYKRGAFMNDELQGDSREYKEAARMYNHDLKEYYRQHNYQVMPEEENVPTSQTGDLSLEEINYYLRKGFDEAEKNKNSAKSFKVAQGYGGNVMRDFSTPFLTPEDILMPKYPYPATLADICNEYYRDNKIYDANENISYRKNKLGVKQVFDLAMQQGMNSNWYDEKMGKYAEQNCLEKGKSPTYCKRVGDSIQQCYRDFSKQADDEFPVFYPLVKIASQTFASPLNVLSRGGNIPISVLNGVYTALGESEKQTLGDFIIPTIAGGTKAFVSAKIKKLLEKLKK